MLSGLLISPIELMRLLILFLFFLLFFFFSQGEDVRHLHIHFKVTNSFGELTNLIVREIYYDGAIDTIYIEKANHSIEIDVDEHVILEFICKGHVTKREAFNTGVPDELKVLPFFDLFVELIEEDLLNSIENKEEIQTLMDFPMGYIKYSTSSRDWYNSQLEFTKTINKLIKKSFK